MRLHEGCRCFAAVASSHLASVFSGVVIGGADPEAARPIGCRPAFTEPMRQTDVIGVHMGGDHAQDGQAF